MQDRRRIGRRMTRGAAAVTALAVLALGAAACGGDDDDPATTAASTAAPAATTAPASTAAAAPAGEFAGTKEHLLSQSAQLSDWTTQFAGLGQQYYDLAEASNFDYAKLWADKGPEVATLLAETKESWIEGNPLYERMEGIVAGVPTLAEYDVILDAGSSAEEDPESAVPFDLTLPDGTVLEQPGAFYNITEGALWGTDKQFVAPGDVQADLDGNGMVDFGEVLPDAAFMLTATKDMDAYAKKLADAAAAWEPTPSDAFTSLVVMVPTMSEYFGQWKDSRFVAGNDATGANFNVVSRLADIGDILSGLQVVYGDVQPLASADDPAQAEQTGKELDELAAFITDLRSKEADGTRFTADEAELLGNQAQERGTAVAGQVSQLAASLGVEIAQ